ncbi:MAG: hydrolase, partial [Lachnospiraceae bacterium]|nr:hydrolase [Lachnospiraceae bacterium]
VLVNGRLHRDSYGNGPGQTKNNYRGKINFINQKGSHPYHVTTPTGGWLGWVTADSVKGV